MRRKRAVIVRRASPVLSPASFENRSCWMRRANRAVDFARRGQEATGHLAHRLPSSSSDTDIAARW